MQLQLHTSTLALTDILSCHLDTDKICITRGFRPRQYPSERYEINASSKSASALILGGEYDRCSLKYRGLLRSEGCKFDHQHGWSITQVIHLHYAYIQKEKTFAPRYARYYFKGTPLSPFANIMDNFSGLGWKLEFTHKNSVYAEFDLGIFATRDEHTRHISLFSWLTGTAWKVTELHLLDVYGGISRIYDSSPLRSHA